MAISERDDLQMCDCGKSALRLISIPNITGTRDSFGIGKNFYDNGKEITTYKQWEKAGYTDPLSDGGWDNQTKELIQKKISKTRETKQDYFNEREV